MRILLVNHGTAGEWGGGDGVQIRETAKRLAQRGHHVEAVNSDQPDARGFDLAHLFNCRVEGSFRQQMASCKQAGTVAVTDLDFFGKGVLGKSGHDERASTGHRWCSINAG